jgi:hypothetical protein
MNSSTSLSEHCDSPFPITETDSTFHHSPQNSDNILMPIPEPTWRDLCLLLERYPDTARDVEETALALQKLYPWYPGPQINFSDGPWPSEKPYFVQKSHLTKEPENFQLAVANIIKAGHILASSDEEYLRYILCHRFGWSATTPAHHNDSWVQYIRHQYPHIENLYPILDDMTWLEEIEYFPSGLCPADPRCLLLATKTTFYLYHYDPEYLMRAGTTLEEVYWGLREEKWIYGEPNQWEIESDNGEDYNLMDYFPIWKTGYKEDQEWDLAYPIMPFIAYSMSGEQP